MGIDEVAEAPVAFADVVDGSRFVTRPAGLAVLAGQSLELRQGFLGPFLAIHRDDGVKARIEPPGFAAQRCGQQQADRQYAPNPEVASEHR